MDLTEKQKKILTYVLASLALITSFLYLAKNRQWFTKETGFEKVLVDKAKNDMEESGKN